LTELDEEVLVIVYLSDEFCVSDVEYQIFYKVVYYHGSLGLFQIGGKSIIIDIVKYAEK
jgi:hypothetical protein